ncbi:hypothetical protein psal_cds_1247 [Pandoravirus salinus]|uniref:Uncharacterized protein n=1 Tax=Pandoravirus salinus TaxID=1349410 RepID=S4W4E3_9VIRU|nr:hypothetical protein psal_cds_1247 [Pandoravirus salinus]AGO85577.1 hypothetical protein psal_cds_1247 [Pandoravirus salinus]
MTTARTTQTVVIHNTAATPVNLHLTWDNGNASASSLVAGGIERNVYKTGDYGAPIKCIGIHVPATNRSWSQCIDDIATVFVTIKADGTIAAIHS